jgi:hypothetical protein
MRNGTIASLLVVAILAGAGGGYLFGVNASGNQSSRGPTTTSCVQTGIHGSLYVRVVSDSADNPISGANVTVTILDYCNSEHPVPLGDTNGTGYTPSPADWTGPLLVNVTNGGVNYVFLTETSGAVSLATLSLPSGFTVVQPIACYGAFPAACSNTTTTTAAYAVG